MYADHFEITCVVGEVNIIQRPKNERVRVGSNVRFTCRAEPEPSSIEWTKQNENKQTTITNVKGKYKLSKQNTVLTVRSVTVDDKGQYSCVVRLGNYVDTKRAELIVEGYDPFNHSMKLLYNKLIVLNPCGDKWWVLLCPSVVILHLV